MISKYLVVALSISITLFASIPANSTTVVRMEVRQGSNAPENVDIKLFDDLANNTVLNFLKYINDGDYINSFFHRSVPGFVIQGGGFTFDPLFQNGSFTYDSVNNLYPGGLQPVPTDPAITNKFAKLNTIGTLAMAKIGGDAHSATSQWFVNLADNPFLDSDNGGYTVFGEVIHNGMGVINSMAAVPLSDKTSIHPLFAELPLANFVTDPINENHLVTINTIGEQFSITPVYSGGGAVVGDSLEPEDVDFGIVSQGSVVSATVTILNKSINTLTLGAIANIDLLSLPYQISSNTCVNAPLAQNTSCDISISFTPVSEGVFDEALNIEFTSMNLSYTLNIHGESTLLPVEANIVPSKTSIVFDETQIYDSADSLPPESLTIQIANDGIIDLNISSFSVVGAFAHRTDCITGGAVKPGGSCALEIAFVPITVGQKTGEITVYSNDPDQSALIIPVSGLAGLDTDKVLTDIENLAPNNGDNNNDDVLDSEQSFVASIKAAGHYVTFLIDEFIFSNNTSNKFINFSLLDQSQFVAAPPDGIQLVNVFQFETYAYAYDPNNVGIVLPEGVIPGTFYLYGPTPNNANPHWYEFMYDGTTGAQIFKNVTMTSPSGNVVKRSIANLTFFDGERGDGDLDVNTRIYVQGGYTVAGAASDSGGSLSFITLILAFFGLCIRCARNNIRFHRR